MNVFCTDSKNMQILRYYSSLFSVPLIIAISLLVTVNYGPVETSAKAPPSGFARDLRFCGDAGSAAIIEPGRNPNTMTGINLRKVSWSCHSLNTRNFNQCSASFFPGNGIWLSARVIQFKSTPLFALHSRLTI